MPKLYCRVNPRTEIEKRDRAGQRFTRNWLELTDIDEATLAALQEDPYLEVSDSPTVTIEVPAPMTAEIANDDPSTTDTAGDVAAEVSEADSDSAATENPAELPIAEAAQAVVEEPAATSVKTGKKAK